MYTKIFTKLPVLSSVIVVKFLRRAIADPRADSQSQGKLLDADNITLLNCCCSTQSQSQDAGQSERAIYEVLFCQDIC